MMFGEIMRWREGDGGLEGAQIISRKKKQKRSNTAVGSRSLAGSTHDLNSRNKNVLLELL